MALPRQLAVRILHLPTLCLESRDDLPPTIHADASLCIHPRAISYSPALSTRYCIVSDQSLHEVDDKWCYLSISQLFLGIVTAATGVLTEVEHRAHETGAVESLRGELFLLPDLLF